ncbi:hypothetical protein [uncultured Agrococcus sp.]|uniref:hypothetical protein n=1 Tax=uncultured Agrococcus sp. TaxID=382258 RepID=UPI0025D75F1B|nr:hypothetical protein [uncultured Agrococcus sp.]
MSRAESQYLRTTQPETDGERTVENIVGDHATILRRGRNIETLGNLMQQAATTLEGFADGSLGAGLSIDGIRKDAKDVYEDLDIAGKLYTPSGAALKVYAGALRDVQNDTDSLVTNSESTWEEVREAAIALNSAVSDQETFDERADNADSGEDLGDRPSSTSERTRFDTAVSEWESYWGAYDAPVSDWESAYSTAVASLEQANESGPEDGFWDNAMPFIEGLLTVLTWIGVIAFVLCFFFTGPLLAVFAAIALVAGIIVVLLEASKFLAGRGDVLSLCLSIVGVVPFAKLATLGKHIKALPTGKFTGAMRHLGSDLGDGLRAFRGMNPRISGFLPSLPFELGIAGVGHFLVRNTPTLIRGNRARWQELAGFPGGPSNLVEALAGVADAGGGVLGTLDGILSLSNQGRHS